MNGKQVRNILGILLFLLIAVLLFNTWNFIEDRVYEAIGTIELTDGWNVSVNLESVAVDSSLEDMKFNNIKKGDVVYMSTMLPAEINLEVPQLSFYTQHCAVEVYIDGERCYKNGKDRYEKGYFVGCGLNTMYIEEEQFGKQLEIYLYVAENNGFTTMESPEIYNGDDFIKYTFTQNETSMIIGIFLAVAGAILQLITCFLIFKTPEFFKMFFVGMFSFFIGVWTVCYTRVVLIFNLPMYLTSTVENVSLFLGTIQLLFYFYPDVKRTESRMLIRVYQVYAVLDISFVAAAFLLHFTNVLHFRQSLLPLHVFILLFVVLIYICVTKNFRRRNMADRIQLLGIVFAAFGVMTDVIIYDLMREWFAPWFGGIPFSAIGTLAFVLCLIIAFVVDLMQNFAKQTEHDILKRYAYTDELTDIGNRHACEEKLKSLDLYKHPDYGIFSIDLNNLKTTNDMKGHDAGDVLIQSFAAILSEEFGKYGFVGRMGGDEFLVVIDSARTFHEKEVLRKVMKRMKEAGQKIDGKEITASFGYAKSEEFKNKNAHEIYKQADNRMYQEKRMFKSISKDGSARD